MAINSKGKITKAQLSQSLIDELMSAVGSGGGSVAIKKYTKTITSNTDRVFIGNEFFNTLTDQLMVFKNSVYLELNEDYRINDDYTISPISGNWEASIEEPEVFNFICLMNTPGDIMFSGSRLFNESVTEDKLSSELQYKINNGVVRPPSTTYRAEKSTITTNMWSAEVNEDGLYTATFTHGLSSRDLIVSGIDTDTGRNIVISYKIIDENSIEVEVSEKINMNLLVVDSNEMEIVVQPGYAEGMITKTITSSMWVEGEDGIKTYDITHGLNSKGLIMSAYDLPTGLNLFLSYKILDNNRIQVRTDEVYDCEINISYRSFNQFFNIDDNNVGETTAYSSSKTKTLIDEVNTTLNKVVTNLEKTENTKYSTVNGVRDIVCEQDGYIDNIYMEGKTLVNMNNFTNKGIDSNRIWLYDLKYTLCKNNTKYTIINIGNKTISVQYTLNKSWVEGGFIVVEPGSQVVVTVNNNYQFGGIFGGAGEGWTISSDYYEELRQSVVILEGDHYGKKIPYFVGMSSVGQDNINILTYKDSNTNICDNSYITGHLYHFTNKSYTDNANCKILQIECLPNTVYKITRSKKSSRFYIATIDKNIQNDYPVTMLNSDRSGNGDLSKVIITPSNARYLLIQTTEANDTNYPIVTVDPVIHDKKIIKNVLRSTGNTKDTIIKQSGKYYRIQRCNEIVINGSCITGSNGITTLTNVLQCSLQKTVSTSDCIDNQYGICDKFMYEKKWDNADYEHCYIDKNSIAIFIDKTKLTSLNLEGVKTFLNDNPITIVYELENPIIEEIPNFNPITFSDKTSIFIDCGPSQTDIDFDITNSLYNELEVLKNKVSDLDNSVLGDEIYYPTLLNGWVTHSSDYTPYFIKSGNIVTFNLRIKSGTWSSGTILLYVPEHFRIKYGYAAVFPAVDLNNDKSYNAIMYKEGFLKLFGVDSEPTGGLAIGGSYYVIK